jgi:RNA polymerase primary sigma factor
VSIAVGMTVTKRRPGTTRQRPPGRPLAAADEIALARRIEHGDVDAWEETIRSNLGLVRALARTYRGRGVPLDDLMQEGTVGLVKAVERFDHRRGSTLSTYATWWIRRSILDALAGFNVIRLPAEANRQLAAVRRAEAELHRGGLGHASDAQIAERAGLNETTVRSLRGAARLTASLDEPIGEDGTPLGDLVADERAIDPLDSALARENHRELSAMLRLLPDRHRVVLIWRYGLNNSRAYSHEEIAQRLGLGKERSRQLEREALHRLRSIAAPSARVA